MLNPHHEADSAAAKGLRYMLGVGNFWLPAPVTAP